MLKIDEKWEKIFASLDEGVRLKIVFFSSETS